MGKECHPLLSGRRKVGRYNHGLSSAEMQSLASVCDAVFPSLPSVSFEGKVDKTIESFYKASAGQAPIPEEVTI